MDVYSFSGSASNEVKPNCCFRDLLAIAGFLFVDWDTTAFAMILGPKSPLGVQGVWK